MRKIKLVRAVLVGVIVLVLAAVVFNYAQTWRARIRGVKQKARILSSDMVRSADTIEYSENDNGVARFRLRAKQLVETRQGKSLLQGIEAFDFNPDGTLRNQIRSQGAEYDRESKQADFSGDVRIQILHGVELRTDFLHYDMVANTGETDSPIKLQSPQVTGTARGARYDHLGKTLELKHDLDFNVQRGETGSPRRPEFDRIHVTAQHGFYSELDATVRFEGNARLDTPSAAMSGEAIVAGFSPDKRRINSLVCVGNAAYDAKDGVQSRSLRGQRIVFGIAEKTRAVEKIDMNGNASFSARDESGSQQLQGSQINMAMDSVKGVPQRVFGQGGVQFTSTRKSGEIVVAGEKLEAFFAAENNGLEHMRVWDRAQMQTRDPQQAQGDSLRADEIRIVFGMNAGRSVARTLEAERSVEWRSAAQDRPGVQNPERSLSSSFMKLIYADDGESLQSGTASGGVTLSDVPVAPGTTTQVRRLQADDVRFAFFPGNNKLKGFEGEGHVHVSYRKPPDPATDSAAQEFQTWSKNIRAQFSESDGTAERITQWGDFKLQENDSTAAAGRADFDVRRHTLHLLESPTISDATSSTRAELIDFDDANKVLVAQKNVRSTLHGNKGEKPTLFASASESGSPTIVTARKMQYWTNQQHAEYSGQVQMLSESSQLQAQQIDIINSGERLEAQGNVKHLVLRSPQGAREDDSAKGDGNPKRQKREDPPTLIESQQLRYVKQANSVHYSEKVALTSGDISLWADTLDAVLDSIGNKINKATATGHLKIKQGERQAGGERADYFPDPGKFVVTGAPAEMRDPQRGKSAARRLTFFSADDRILLENR